MAKRPKQLDFEDVRRIALELPDVQESATSRGTALKVRGRILTCPAIHASAEPNSIMVRVSFEERARLLATEPDRYYLTDHYSGYPAILVRLAQTNPRVLRDLLDKAREFGVGKVRRRKR